VDSSGFQKRRTSSSRRQQQKRRSFLNTNAQTSCPNPSQCEATPTFLAAGSQEEAAATSSGEKEEEDSDDDVDDNAVRGRNCNTTTAKS
jgi:hypothetical protein